MPERDVSFDDDDFVTALGGIADPTPTAPPEPPVVFGWEGWYILGDLDEEQYHTYEDHLEAMEDRAHPDRPVSRADAQQLLDEDIAERGEPMDEP